jgi:hypothetical protein
MESCRVLATRVGILLAMVSTSVSSQEVTRLDEWGFDRGVLAGSVGGSSGGTVGAPLTLRWRRVLDDRSRLSVEQRATFFDGRPGLDPAAASVAFSSQFMLTRSGSSDRPYHLRPYSTFGPVIAAGRGDGSAESIVLWGARAGYGLNFPLGASAIRVEAVAQYDVARGRPTALNHFPSRLRGGVSVGLSSLLR